MIPIIHRTSVIECTGCCPGTQAGCVLFVCQEFSVDHSDGQILRGFELFHYFPMSSILYIMYYVQRTRYSVRGRSGEREPWLVATIDM